MHPFRRPAVATELALFGVSLPRLIANMADSRIQPIGVGACRAAEAQMNTPPRALLSLASLKDGQHSPG